MNSIIILVFCTVLANTEAVSPRIVSKYYYDHENGQSKILAEVRQLDDIGHADYLEIDRNVTRISKLPRDGERSGPATVELLIVCDKDFGDVFGHDRDKIWDYWSVYFWDVSVRYNTLMNSEVTFRITGIVTISDAQGQPFIEEARDSEGRTSHNRVLPNFDGWVYRQRDTLPRFDAAVSITNSKREWNGGLAWVAGACAVDPGWGRYWTAVWDDDGRFGSIAIAAHEIAHSLGMHHDDHESCSDLPREYDGRYKWWFFSDCTDRGIRNFLNSPESDCLRRIDERRAPAVNPDFSDARPPSISDQCKLDHPDAYSEEEEGSCWQTRCWLWNAEDNHWSSWHRTPVDSSPCGNGGQCFRGECRRATYLLKNKGAGKCMRAIGGKYKGVWDRMELIDCVEIGGRGFPYNRFDLNETSISTVLSTREENTDRCVFSSAREEVDNFPELWTDRCDAKYRSQASNKWKFETARGNDNEILICSQDTGFCAKVEDSKVIIVKEWDKNDPQMHWQVLY